MKKISLGGIKTWLGPLCVTVAVGFAFAFFGGLASLWEGASQTAQLELSAAGMSGAGSLAYGLWRAN